MRSPELVPVFAFDDEWKDFAQLFADHQIAFAGELVAAGLRRAVAGSRQITCLPTAAATRSVRLSALKSKLSE